MKYGAKPKIIGVFPLAVEEMMFYQDMPIKLSGQTIIQREDRISSFDKIIGAACCDFVGMRGLDAYVSSNVYLCAKRLFQPAQSAFNRPGWHSDGFGSGDINYLWSDCVPIIFNFSKFDLSDNDAKSIKEMEDQAKPEFDYVHEDNTLLRLDQFNIHRVALIDTPCVRTFAKVTFSPDIYNLAGNTRNYLLDYQWEMRERSASRNIPQSK